MAAPLAFLFLLSSWAAAGAAPADACPSDDAVTAQIAHLGAARARAQTGTIDVSVEEASMRIVLRARDGTILGMREVAAPGACEERAVVAAVVVTAWLGEWAASAEASAAAETPALTRAAGAPPSPSLSPPAPAPPERRAGGDVAAFAFGAHDGDAGTWGVGAQASYGLGAIAAVTALGEVTGERQLSLGPGQALYRFARVGVGIAARRALGRGVLIDGALGPQAVLLSLHGGEGLATRHAVTAWGLAADARARLGLGLGAIVPFLYVDASYALTGARLTLDNNPSSATLSRWGLAAGLGILWRFGPFAG